MNPPSTVRNETAAADASALADENAELKVRLQELEDTLHAIHRGDVDALVVNNDIYTLESVRAATNRLRQDVLGQMQDAVFAFDNDGHLIYLNPAAERRYGLASGEVVGRHKSFVFREADEASELPASGFGTLDEVPLAAAEHRAGVAATHVLADGSVLHVESVESPLLDEDGQSFGTLAVIRDVTQRRRLEVRRDALAVLTDRLRTINRQADVGLAVADALAHTLGAERAGYALVDADSQGQLGDDAYTPSDAPALGAGVPLADFGEVVEPLQRNQLVVVADVRLHRRTAAHATALLARGVAAFVEVPVVEQERLVGVLFAHCAAARPWLRDDIDFMREIAERAQIATGRLRDAQALRRSESQLRKANENLEAAVLERSRKLLEAEEALRQSQKMEAVGQLTGGIAHDFNNLLAAMGGSLQVMQARLQQGRLDGIERYVAIGQESVKRAASLTQRLLAFARRQTLDPKATDLNRLVLSMEDLLRRSVGPDVAIEVLGASELWLTRIDPSQLENSLLNLCINARDAMLPGGGRLTIETSNRVLEAWEAGLRDLPAGPYVCLRVTDTGTGMPADVIKRIFDPFFTTKPLGQGTGLGLSMVYGFVRQSGGQIHVASTPGEGTAMTLYLPRHDGGLPHEEGAVAQNAPPSGAGEQLLVIEDELNVRQLLCEVLTEAGYSVLSAQDGPEGLRLLQTAARVDLLVTDVGLPGGLNGRQVADAARVSRPGLKVLFITGYAANAVVGNGLLAPGMQVLTKPFDMLVLVKQVKELLARS